MLEAKQLRVGIRFAFRSFSSASFAPLLKEQRTYRASRPMQQIRSPVRWRRRGTREWRDACGEQAKERERRRRRKETKRMKKLAKERETKKEKRKKLDPLRLELYSTRQRPPSILPPSWKRKSGGRGRRRIGSSAGQKPLSQPTATRRFRYFLSTCRRRGWWISLFLSLSLSPDNRRNSDLRKPFVVAQEKKG